MFCANDTPDCDSFPCALSLSREHACVCVWFSTLKFEIARQRASIRRIFEFHSQWEETAHKYVNRRMCVLFKWHIIIEMTFWQSITVPMGKYFFFLLLFLNFRTNGKFVRTHTLTHMLTWWKRLKVVAYMCCVVFVFFLLYFLFTLGLSFCVFWVYHDTVLTHLFHDGRYNLLAFFPSVSASLPFFRSFSPSSFAFALSMHTFLYGFIFFFSNFVRQLIAHYDVNNNVTHFMRWSFHQIF